MSLLDKNEKILTEIVAGMTVFQFTPSHEEKGQWVTGTPEDQTQATLFKSKTVFQHSFWTLCHMARWIDKNPDLIGDRILDASTLLSAAFFHDIGRASGCAVTCSTTCWFDVYSALKNKGDGDRAHHQLSGQILSGKEPFLSCNVAAQKLTDDLGIRFADKWTENFSSYESEHSTKIYLTNDFFQMIDANQKVVALAAYMHWELLPLARKWTYDKKEIMQGLLDESKEYLSNFEKACQKLEIRPSPCLLDICILVSFADIRSSAEPFPEISQKDLDKWVTKYKLFRLLKDTGFIDLKTLNVPFYTNGRNLWQDNNLNHTALPLRQVLRNRFLSQEDFNVSLISTQDNLNL